MVNDVKYTLMQLAEKTGVSPRTIRFYISRGLLDGPIQVGRGAAYTEQHLQRLLEVKSKKETGLTLHEIGVSKGHTEPDEIAAVTWLTFAIEDDVTISVRSDAAPWRMRQIRKVLGDIAPLLRKPYEGD